MINEIEKMKCSSCIHFPLCLAQKGGMNLGLASENNCEYFQPKLPEDIVMLTREGYDILIAVENERIKEARKKTVEKTLQELYGEFSRYKCYEYASEYLYEYAKIYGVRLKQ